MLTTNKVNWDTLFISVNQEHLMPLHVGQFIKSLGICVYKALYQLYDWLKKLFGFVIGYMINEQIFWQCHSVQHSLI